MYKQAVDVSGLRKMWSKLVNPLYARQTRSYAKGARKAGVRHAQVQGYGTEVAVAKQRGFKPTPQGVSGGIPEYTYKGSHRHNTAVAFPPHKKGPKLIYRGRHLVPDDELAHDAARASRRRSSAKYVKTYGEGGGVVMMEPGSAYANIHRADRVKQKAFNRIKQRTGRAPQADKSVKSGLTGEDQEIFNRMIGGHEAREVRFGASRNMRYTGLDDAEFASHAMPSVILKNDLNIANTLPARNSAVRNEIIKMRTPEIRNLQEMLPQHREVLEKTLQGQRLSRHEIKAIDRDFAAVRGFKKRGRQAMRRRRLELRKAQVDAVNATRPRS